MKNIIYNHRVSAEIQMYGYGVKKDIYWSRWPMEIISRRHKYMCIGMCIGLFPSPLFTLKHEATILSSPDV